MSQLEKDIGTKEFVFTVQCDWLAGWVTAQWAVPNTGLSKYICIYIQAFILKSDGKSETSISEVTRHFILVVWLHRTKPWLAGEIPLPKFVIH